MNIPKKITLLFFFLAFAMFSRAECIRTVTVRSLKKDVWSEKKTIEVKFLNGIELNALLNSDAFISHAIYVYFVSDNNTPKVVRVRNTSGCGVTLTCPFIDNSLNNLFGYDEEQLFWQINVLA